MLYSQKRLLLNMLIETEIGIIRAILNNIIAANDFISRLYLTF